MVVTVKSEIELTISQWIIIKRGLSVLLSPVYFMAQFSTQLGDSFFIRRKACMELRSVQALQYVMCFRKRLITVGVLI